MAIARAIPYKTKRSNPLLAMAIGAVAGKEQQKVAKEKSALEKQNILSLIQSRKRQADIQQQLADLAGSKLSWEKQRYDIDYKRLVSTMAKKHQFTLEEQAEANKFAQNMALLNSFLQRGNIEAAETLRHKLNIDEWKTKNPRAADMADLMVDMYNSQLETAKLNRRLQEAGLDLQVRKQDWAEEMDLAKLDLQEQINQQANQQAWARIKIDEDKNKLLNKQADIDTMLRFTQMQLNAYENQLDRQSKQDLAQMNLALKALGDSTGGKMSDAEKELFSFMLYFSDQAIRQMGTRWGDVFNKAYLSLLPAGQAILNEHGLNIQLPKFQPKKKLLGADSLDVVVGEQQGPIIAPQPQVDQTAKLNLLRQLLQTKQSSTASQADVQGLLDAVAQKLGVSSNQAPANIPSAPSVEAPPTLSPTQQPTSARPPMVRPAEVPINPEPAEVPAGYPAPIGPEPAKGAADFNDAVAALTRAVTVLGKAKAKAGLQRYIDAHPELTAEQKKQLKKIVE